MDKKKMMDNYEIDSMWMSYRYCIGRKTISATSRAHEIAKHCYKRMSDEYSIEISSDIRKHISYVLKDIYSFYINGYYEGNIKDNSPIECFLSLLASDLFPATTMQAKEDKLYGYKSMFCNFGPDGTRKFSAEKSPDKRTFMPKISDMDYLIEWDTLANLLNIRSHKYATLQDNSRIEIFYAYKPCILKNAGVDRYGYKKYAISVDGYLKDKYSVVPDELIVKVEDIWKNKEH